MAGLQTQTGAEDNSSLPDEANDSETRILPAYLQSMYDDAATRLPGDQVAILHDLLLIFANVFATHDLDIGEFISKDQDLVGISHSSMDDIDSIRIWR